jgi:hypothetical protein
MLKPSVEREQAEEDAAVPGEQKAQHEGEEARGQRAHEHLQEDVAHAEKTAKRAGGVGAQAVIQRLAERHQPRAQEQHQAERHHAVGAGNGDQKHRPLRQEISAHQDGGEDDADEQRRPVRPQIFLGSARLNRPRGRNASTMAITK